MKKLSREMLKQIMFIKLNSYEYRILYKKSANRFWTILLSVSLLMMILSVLFLTKQLENDLLGIKNNEIDLILFSSIMIFICYKVLRIKIKRPSIEGVYTKSSEEAKFILEKLRLEEKVLIRRIKWRIANSITLFILLLATYLIILFNSLIDYDYDIINLIDGYGKNGFPLDIGLLFLLIFVIGDLLGAPIGPGKYKERQNKINYKVKDYFMVNLYLSNLNPEVKDENN